MARARVQVYAGLRRLLGKPSLWVEARTAAEALSELARAAGPEAQGLLFDEKGALRNEFLPALGAQMLDRNALDRTALEDGSVLHIFPPVSGG
jgi:molybdopterin converting factor small subunit